jgi:hypothetical protein
MHFSERDSSGGALARRTEMREAHQRCAMRMRYERSEPRIARRELQKKSSALKVLMIFFVRSGSPKLMKK